MYDLDESDVELFARPLGLVVLSYSLIDAALTGALEALQDKDRWEDGGPDGDPRNDISKRFKFLKKLLKSPPQNGMEGDGGRIIRKALKLIKYRNCLVHGRWWRNDLYNHGRIHVAWYQPRNPFRIPSVTPKCVLALAEQLNKVADELDGLAVRARYNSRYKVLTPNKLGGMQS